MTSSRPLDVALFPPEIILHIFSYLDLPELDVIGHISSALKRLTQDPALHRVRIRVVAPARVDHSLFARGGSLRPTIADLVHWNVLRGLGFERRWRMGLYLYSPQSVKQYENSQRLKSSHVRHLLSTHLKHQTRLAKASQDWDPVRPMRKGVVTVVLPDMESASPSVARSLLPALHKLNWCIRRDKLARMVRGQGRDFINMKSSVSGNEGGVNVNMVNSGVLGWLEGKGRGKWKETERIRLAICPGIGKIVRRFEELGRK